MFDSETRPRKPGFSTGGFRILSNQSKEEQVDKPILMEFPLQGEWLSPNTPGTKVPSHGTNRLGTRYAYDFIQVDWERPGRPSYRGGLLRYLLFGIPVEDYFCWGQYTRPAAAPSCWQKTAIRKTGGPDSFPTSAAPTKAPIPSTPPMMIYRLSLGISSSSGTRKMSTRRSATCKPAQSGFPPGSLSARGKSLGRSAIPAIPFSRTSTSS